MAYFRNADAMLVAGGLCWRGGTVYYEKLLLNYLVQGKDINMLICQYACSIYLFMLPPDDNSDFRITEVKLINCCYSIPFK